MRYGKGRQYGPSITYKITTAGSLSSSRPGGPPCWTSHLAFGLIGILLPNILWFYARPNYHHHLLVLRSFTVMFMYPFLLPANMHLLPYNKQISCRYHIYNLHSVTNPDPDKTRISDPDKIRIPDPDKIRIRDPDRPISWSPKLEKDSSCFEETYVL